jgi:2-oxoglutarate ferredoxin oxidoreductase subunit gamma
MYERILLAGSGGQGVMTLGKVLARAAMLSDLHCTYLPSYGTEVRGGTANCQVIISDEEIYSPVVEAADTLIAMNEPSYRRFRGQVTPEGLIVLNTSMAQAEGANGHVLGLPASDLANDLGDVRVANAVMLGGYNGRRRLLADDLLFDQLSYAFGGLTGRLLDLNRAAFQAGLERAASHAPASPA